jgi:hypothetical protein
MAGIFRRKSLTWDIEIARKPTVSACFFVGPQRAARSVYAIGMRRGRRVADAKPKQRPDIRADVAFTLPKLLVHHSAAQIAILIVRDFRQPDGYACDWRPLETISQEDFV